MAQTPPLALLLVWMVVALRVTRLKMATIAAIVTLNFKAWVNRSCTVKRLMPAVTKIASHQQDGADAILALLMVWMVVALRVTRLTMATITPLAMLVIGLVLTRTCGSTDE